MLPFAADTCTLDVIRFISDEPPAPCLAVTLGAGGAKGARKLSPGTAREIGLPPALAIVADSEGMVLKGFELDEPSLPRLKV